MASRNQKGSVKARAIVTHIGADESGGEWVCSKDGKSPILCTHQRLAAAYLVKITGRSDKVENTVDIGPDVGK